MGLCVLAQKTEGKARMGEREADNLVCRGWFGHILHLHYYALGACDLEKGKRILSTKAAGFLTQQPNFTHGGILNLSFGLAS